jgi:hypothetical protein
MGNKKGGPRCHCCIMLITVSKHFKASEPVSVCSNLFTFRIFVFSKVSHKRPVHEHEANAVSAFFFVQYLPCHCSLIGDWPSHTWQADTTWKAHKTLLTAICNKLTTILDKMEENSYFSFSGSTWHENKY